MKDFSFSRANRHYFCLIVSVYSVLSVWFAVNLKPDVSLKYIFVSVKHQEGILFSFRVLHENGDIYRSRELF